MNSCFFVGFQSSGLSMGKPARDAAFRESPAPATASLHQQKFDALAACAITDRGDLADITQLAQMRHSDERPGRAPLEQIPAGTA